MTDATAKLRDPRVIVITGASSGIGAALAQHYARPGVRLLLTGRHAERLEKVSERCRGLGAQVEARVLDILDREAVAAWLLEEDTRMPIDLVIANAGISAGSGGGAMNAEPVEQVRAIFSVNVDGVINTVAPLIPRMVARKSGQLALMSSLAGFRGLPSSPAYSASKAAVRVYGEGLRGLLAERGVYVSVVCPGYIHTPMTARNPFWMPFIMPPDKAAIRIARGLARNQSRIAFPWALAAPLWLLACLPPHFTDRFFASLPAKPAIT